MKLSFSVSLACVLCTIHFSYTQFCFFNTTIDQCKNSIYLEENVECRKVEEFLSTFGINNYIVSSFDKIQIFS